MTELERLELTFKEERKTLRAVLFEEQLGEQSFSDQDVAVGVLYVKKQALEMIGNPTTIKVTIEPVEGG